MLKAKPCAECGSAWHTKGYHKPRKPLDRVRRPMKHESDKSRLKRQETSQEWYKLHQPPYYCYISKHPMCPKLLSKETMVLEHERSKARHPEDKYNVDNLYPACVWDNEAKGSLSAEEYLNKGE